MDPLDHAQPHDAMHGTANAETRTGARVAGTSASDPASSRPAVARHYLRHWEATRPAFGPPARSRPAMPAVQTPARPPVHGEVPTGRLDAGRALKLRASTLSVLRIAHGRVWVTLTDVGPWSRVLAGDHFLSRGDSLTLLPGQELVMESFSASHDASARFTWEAAGASARAEQPAPSVNLQAGIRQPWLDLRHATGLALGAAGRLAHGLSQAGTALVASMLAPFAMIFVATRASNTCASSRFDTKNGDSAAPCRL